MFAALSSSEKIIEKSKKFLEKGKRDKALQVLEDALRKDPRNYQFLLVLGELHCAFEEAPAAQREWRKAFKAHPDKAQEILDALTHPPGKVNEQDFGELRLEILVYLRELEAASEWIYRLEADFLTPFLDRTVNRIAELKRLSRSDRDRALFNELTYIAALILECRGEREESFRQYAAILECRMEERDHVLPRLESLAREMKGDADPFLYLGAFFRDRDPEKSTLYYSNALDADPRAASVVIDDIGDPPGGILDDWILGRAYLIQGAWSEAAKHFQEIQVPSLVSRIVVLLKEVDGSRLGTEPVLLLLGDLLVATASHSEAAKTYAALTDRVDAAVLRSRFNRIFKLDPDNPEAAEAFVQVCLDESDLAGSIFRMRQILASDPTQSAGLFQRVFPLIQERFEDSELCLFLAELSLDDREVAHPVVLIRRFIQLSPESADRTMPLLSKLVSAFPAHPLVRIALGEMHVATGEDRDAVNTFQIALALAPDTYWDVIHPLSMIAQRSPGLRGEIEVILSELEGRGISDPALDFVWAEAALASGDYEIGVERLLRALSQAPEQRSVVESCLNHWVKSHPHETALVLGLAQLHVESGREDAAAECLNQSLRDNPAEGEQVAAAYRKMLEGRPGSLALYEGMLKAYLRGGFYDLVLEEGKRLERQFQAPEIAAIHEIMGDARREMGRFTGAVTLYYQAFKEDAGRGESIGGKLENIRRLHPALPNVALALGVILPAVGRVGDGVEALMTLARELPDHRDAVLKCLTHMVRKHPVSQEPILGMAALHTMLGADQKALKFVWKALQRRGRNMEAILHLLDEIAAKNPELAPVQLEIGKAYLSAGLPGKSAEHFAQSVIRDPSLSEQAVKYCHDIIAAHPDEIKAYESISKILVGLGRREAAVAFLESSGESHPPIRGLLLPQMVKIAREGEESPHVLKALAGSYLAAGKPAEAVSAMSRAVTLSPSLAGAGTAFLSELLTGYPENGDALLERGRCRMHSLALTEAFDDIRAAVELSPEKADQGISLLEQVNQMGLAEPGLHLFLGKLYSRKGDHDAAIAILEAGREKASQDAEKLSLLLSLSQAYEKQGNMSRARSCLEESKGCVRDPADYYRKVHAFTLKALLFETRSLEQRAAAGETLTVSEILKLIEYLVLQDCESKAEALVQSQLECRTAEESRAIWSCFYEATGSYRLAAQLADGPDLYRRSYLLAQAGESLQATVLLESLLHEKPDPNLQHYLNQSCLSLMEVSLLQEQLPLMGETRLRISEIYAEGA